METMLIALISQVGLPAIQWVVTKWLTAAEPTGKDWAELLALVNVKLEVDLKAALARAGVSETSEQGKKLLAELLKVTCPTCAVTPK